MIRRTVLAFLLLFVIGTVTFFVQKQVQAITCTGVGTCIEQGSEDLCDGGPKDGQSCSGDDFCFPGTCEEFPTNVNTDPSNPCRTYAGIAGCRATCPYSGWLYQSGSCPAPIPDPTPPPNRWTCNGNSCSQSYTGYASYGDCMTACNPPTPPPTPPPSATPYKWACSGYSCVVSPSGPFPDFSSCDINCRPPDPSPTPTPTSTPTPPSGCYNEQDCVNLYGGTINDHDCCEGACVPEGTNCGPPGCTGQNRATFVWLRVISNENNQTVAWKGPKDVDRVVGSNWSANSLDPDGYFTTYKPYSNSSVYKTFDKTKNVISSGMQVTLDTYPKSPETYKNSCGDDEYYPEDINKLAHGETWSNHFCSAGYAYEPDSTGKYPKESNNFCITEKDSGSPYYFDVPLSDPDLDCDGDPRIWPVADPDGCYNGLSQPTGGKPWQDGVYSSSHPDLIPILTEANNYYSGAGKSWVDLPYDGYWTLTYQAYEQYQNTKNIDTVITIKPPTGHTCGDVRWFNKNDDDVKEQQPKMIGNADGTCTISFNPKPNGNFVVLEVNRNKTQSCTVQFEDTAGNFSESLTDITTGFNVHVIGNSSEVIPPETERTRLFFMKSDFTKYEGTLPAHFATPSPEPADGKYVYEFKPADSGQSCNSNSDQSCSMTATIDAGTLEHGEEYTFFCDVPNDDPVYLHQCSGNPTCSYNGGTVNCSTLSPPWADCADENLNPDDNGTVTVSCANTCDLQCAKPGDTNACDGTPCSPGSNVTMTTVPPQLVKPDPAQEVTENLGGPTEYYFPMTWNSPADTTNLDGYEYIVYKQGAFDSAQEAYDANLAHKNSTLPPERHPDVLFDAYTTKENLGFGAVPAPDASQYAMGLDFTAAVRAANSLYGVCSAGGYVYSSWDTKDFTLVGTVAGTVFDDPTDSGSTTTPVTNFPSTAEVIVRGVLPSFNITRLVSGSTYSVPGIPYNHYAWTLPNFSAELAINNNDEANWFVCSDAPGQFNGGENCTISDIASPQADTDFFVKSFNLRFESWWQSWGGNVFGRTGIVSAIPDGNDSPCADSSDCHPHLVAADHTQGVSVDEQSAGVPVTENGAIQTGIDSRFSEQSAPGPDNPRATDQETGSVTIENYTYFLTSTELTNAALAGGSKNATEFKTQLGNGEVEDDAKVVRYNSDLTLNLTSTKLNIGATEKFIVFIDGNLEIEGPANHSISSQRELINVTEGGYLAFIVSGNITFDSTIGYDDPDDSDWSDVGVSQISIPNVEGVYIASNNLIVESNGTKDFKFVGAGTFVGWNSVDLLRQFEGDTLLRKQLNNLSPTELFIHRADLVTNTPEFMMRPQLTWQEVR